MVRFLIYSLLFISQVYAITIDTFETSQAVSQGSNGSSGNGVSSNTSLGGKRHLSARKLGGGGQVTLAVYEDNGIFLADHNQGTSGLGATVITWDGTIDSGSKYLIGSVNTSSLPSLDLAADGATSFILGLGAIDVGLSSNLKITIRIFGPNNGQLLVSQASKTFTTSSLTPIQVEFPFNTFSMHPDSDEPASINNVTAIQLVLDGTSSQAADLEITQFKTNGECNLVPQIIESEFKIYGDCGFCYDQDQQKNQCQLCPQHPLYNNCLDCAGDPCILEGNPVSGYCRKEAQLDTCGVCQGDGSSCSDCNGTPYGGAVLDQCGVCGGNNSCIDCAGTLFGQAKIDHCGVCGGDNSSCVSCKTINVTPLLFALDAEAKNQELPIQRMLRELVKHDKRNKNIKLRSEIGLRARELQVRNWVISWAIDGFNTQCVNVGSLAICDFSDLTERGDEFGPRSLCIDPNSASQNAPSYCLVKDVNQSHANEYRIHAGELWELTKRVAKILERRSKKVGVFQATKLNNARKAGLYRGRKSYKRALALVNRVPLKAVNCTAP